jgi:arylsulfatase A-like enzyme
MLGNRGIYKDGWWAGSRHLLPWQSTQLANWEQHTPEQTPWELYNLNDDSRRMVLISSSVLPTSGQRLYGDRFFG